MPGGETLVSFQDIFRQGGLVLVYLFFLAGGVLWVLLTLITGGIADHDTAASVDHDLGDASHSGGGDSSGGDPHISPFQPLVLACSAATFGGTGLFLSAIGLNRWLALLPALVISLVVGAAVFYLVKFLARSESNAAFSLEEVVGSVGTVTIPVKPAATGEVRFTYRGTIHQVAAKPLLDEKFRYGEKVLICKIEGKTALVSRSGDLGL